MSKPLDFSIFPPEAVPDLSLVEGTPAQRIKANIEQFHKHKASAPHKAAVYIERAWILGDRRPEIYGVLIDIFKQLRDDRRIYALSREAAFAAYQSHNHNYFTEAVRNFQQVAILHGYFVQDCFINAYTQELFTPHRNTCARPKDGQKKHIVYIPPFAHDPKSALPPIPFEICEDHDFERFKVTILILLDENTVRNHNPGLIEHAEKARERGVETRFFEQGGASSSFERLIAIRDYIESLKCDALGMIFQAFEEFFLAALRPAPVIFGLDSGQPDWYSSEFLDFIAATQRHFGMEARCESLYTPLGMTRTHYKHTEGLHRKDLGIPDGKKFVMTSGMHSKYEHPQFWQIVQKTLEQEDVVWAMMGIDESQYANVLKNWSATARSRLKFLGYRKDFLDVVLLADLYVDTYPVGGGYALVEVMRQGIPTLCYPHNYNMIFNKKLNYSPFYDYYPSPDYGVDFADYGQFYAQFKALLHDQKIREERIALQKSMMPYFEKRPGAVRQIETKITALLDAR